MSLQQSVTGGGTCPGESRPAGATRPSPPDRRAEGWKDRRAEGRKDGSGSPATRPAGSRPRTPGRSLFTPLRHSCRLAVPSALHRPRPGLVPGRLPLPPGSRGAQSGPVAAQPGPVAEAARSSHPGSAFQAGLADTRTSTERCDRQASCATAGGRTHSMKGVESGSPGRGVASRVRRTGEGLPVAEGWGDKAGGAVGRAASPTAA